jgi:hypothetical protein
MKLTLALLILLSQNCFSQEKIEGFWKLKLKKTTIAFLDTLAKEREFERVEIHTHADYYNIRNKQGKLAEVFPDTIDIYNSPSYAHYCKEARVFFISDLKISEIDFKKIYLTFFRDTLIEIQTEFDSKIVEALELKYGEPRFEKKESKANCTLKLTGTQITYTEKMFYKYWENGNIKCTTAIGDYRDSNCEKNFLSYINISIDRFLEKLSECDRKEKDKIQQKKDQEKKKLLDDF